ncbi:hypothetical protein VNI00_006591 [Paramarasmius palmivorus]|uniref:ER-bound oxygenase mpaB/mpaB'/Rubber oxygenase catalytic domain-containing protein n=1 Tax=Paramarasmius palmivorus TaxID=297713 RepID=A0AAW0D8C0_9AGAR
MISIQRLIHKFPRPLISLPSILIVIYLLLVRSLRWKRYNYIQRTYGSKYRTRTLSLEDAQAIIAIGSQYELPAILEYSVAFALFKTYAIPSISKILAGTKELKSDEMVAKRYADVGVFVWLHVFYPLTFHAEQTGILIATWVRCPINGYSPAKPGVNDPRANLAIARVNWLHSHYPIKNEDHLYTLALFMFEPEKWSAKYGWRELAPIEKHASFMFWSEVGRRMGIKDIPETAETFKEWVQEYEERAMYPAQTNCDVASFTLEELIHTLPEHFGMRSLARILAIAMLEDNVREAMMLPPPPRYIKLILHYTLKSSPSIFAGLIEPDLPDSILRGETKPLMRPKYFTSKPWYKPQSESFIGRTWDALMVQMGKYEDIPSEKWRSEGYRLDTIGPVKYENAGQDKVFSTAEELQGCPISAVWKAK